MSAGLLTVRGEEDLVSGDTGVGHPLLTSQHPDDHIRHAVLGLDTVTVKTCEQMKDGCFDVKSCCIISQIFYNLKLVLPEVV